MKTPNIAKYDHIEADYQKVMKAYAYIFKPAITEQVIVDLSYFSGVKVKTIRIFAKYGRIN